MSEGYGRETVSAPYSNFVHRAQARDNRPRPAGPGTTTVVKSNRCFFIPGGFGGRRLRRPIAVAGTVALVLSGIHAVAAAGGPAVDTLSVESVSPGRAPQVEEKRLLYTLDLTFSTLPGRYWVYFDRIDTALVVELYDTHLRESLPRRQLGSEPFVDLQVVNTSSMKSITGRQARLLIPLDDVWHYKAEKVGQRTLRVILWKPLEASPPPAKNPMEPYVAYGAVAVATSLFTIAIIAVSGRQSP